jgi:hypothetical protein
MFPCEWKGEVGKRKGEEDGNVCLCNNRVTENLFSPINIDTIGGILIH